MIESIKTTKARLSAINQITNQLHTLNALLETSGNLDITPINQIIGEKSAVLNWLESPREFTFNFVHGGWNTVRAKDAEEAYEKAVFEYNRPGNSFNYEIINSEGLTETRTMTNPDTIVDQSTIRIASENEMNYLLSLFN